MKIKKIFAGVLSVMLLTTMLAGCSNTKEEGKSEASKTLNVAIQPSGAFAPFFVVREKGWLEEALADQGVTVNWTDFESGPPMNESMAAGSSDIAFVGDVPTVSAIAAGQENEVVATTAVGGKSYSMVVKADSDIKSVKDLKGKKVGTTIGSTAQNLVEKLLAKDGLDINKDIELVNISPGEAKSVISSGDIDAVVFWEPTPTQLIGDKVGRVIAHGPIGKFLGINTLVVRKEYAQNNPEVMKVILEQYARGAAELKNLDDETKQAAAKYLSVTPEQFMDIVTTKYDYTVKIADADVDSLQDTIDFLVRVGNLDETYDIKPYVNKTYLESADIDQYLK